MKQNKISFETMWKAHLRVRLVSEFFWLRRSEKLGKFGETFPMNSRKIDYVVVALNIKPQDMGFFKVNDLPLTPSSVGSNPAAPAIYARF